MALLNFSSPFLATPNPLAHYYQPPQPTVHQLPPYHQQTPYSYPPPQKPFLDEDYGANVHSNKQEQGNLPPPQQQVPYQAPPLPNHQQQHHQHQPTFTRVTEDGSKTKVHAVIDYDEYEDDDEEPMPPVTPIQGPIYLKNGSVPVVPLYSHPVLNNGSFVQIPILWTALSVALGLELRGEYIRGVPCIKRHQQLFCPTAGNSYPLDRIELFIDENKALMKRMYGEFIMPDYEDSERSYTTATKQKRSVKPGVPDIHFDPGPEPHIDTGKSQKRRIRQNFKNMSLNNNKNNESGRVDACESKLEIVTPYWASNSAGKVRAIVNTQHFEQAIHQEVCAKTSTKRCSDECGCEQKYKWHRLLAYDPDNDCRGIFMDWFLFPSCCVCRCNP
ncbi:hypothetical protein ABEB36_008417 [Hypothenemus hampei]|uniref:Spaetzle domain-containing protein n=1 Tax=Hypothenemus hampei TaxID=57062 RepID=A0ABD1ENZ4_HYPHA